MPEGDSILKVARRLSSALAGEKVIEVKGSLPSLDGLVGHVVERVEARGKNVLAFFDDARVLHTHLGMHGIWQVARTGQRWRRPAHQLRIGLFVEGRAALCFDARRAAVLREKDLATFAPIRDLGPDLLAQDFDADVALERLRGLASVPIGEALLDQRALAGVGNVFKSEVLYLCKTNPFVPVQDLDDSTLERLIETSRKLLRRNAGAGARRTRFAFDGPRVHVYDRRGEACLVCGDKIAMRRQGEQVRSTYYCPACQRVEG